MRSFLRFIIIFFISVHSFSFAQNQPEFKSDDFRKDIDYLIDTLIAQAYPKLEVFNAVSSRDMLEEMNKKRDNLSNSISHAEFIETVTEILQLTTDGHSRIKSASLLDDIIDFYNRDELERLFKFVDTSSISISLANKHFFKLYSLNTEYMKKMKFLLHVNYINGNYYNLLSVKTEKDIIDVGSIIKEVNGIDIHDWVNNHLGDYSFIRYDKENKRYYTNLFFVTNDIFKSNKVEIKWLTPQNITKKASFKVDVPPNIDYERFLSINLAKVKYFRKPKLLYIRLKDMSDSRKYLEKIEKLGNRKEIKRVIVDIRDNPGGNDRVWKEIVEVLIDKPITVDLNVVTKKNSITSKYFGSDLTEETIGFQGTMYSKFDMRMLETYIPSSTSINFKNKIILIVNENIFSSAGSFAAIANYSNKFITVGRPSNLPIGVGVTPMYVMLPNTKTLIQLDPTIDITNCKKYDDLFRSVDIPVEITPESEHIWRTKNFSRWKWSFLSKYDPYLQKALEVDIKK